MITSIQICEDINTKLQDELNGIILSPIIGIIKIRKVLENYDIFIPALYDLPDEGEEIILEVNEEGEVCIEDIRNNSSYLYILYELNDGGTYDFYTEFTDKIGIEEILNEDELEDDI